MVDIGVRALVCGWLAICCGWGVAVWRGPALTNPKWLVYGSAMVAMLGAFAAIVGFVLLLVGLATGA
jgi:hypothetical protein